MMCPEPSASDIGCIRGAKQGKVVLFLAAAAMPFLRKTRRSRRQQHARDPRASILVTYDAFGERAHELG
jgi:hypothetical protein